MEIRSIHTEKAPAAVGPYSQAIIAGDYIFVSGSLGIDPSTGKLKENLEAQVTQALTNMKNILASAGVGIERVVKTTVFLADMDDFQSMNKIYAEFFGHTKPARSTIEVARLPLGAKFEIEAIAYTK